MADSGFAALARRGFIRSVLAATALAVGLWGCGSDDEDNGAAQTKYHASWTGALSDAFTALPGRPAGTPQTFNDQTVRQVMRLSLGGNALRVKVSNLFGRAPITIQAARVAKSVGQSGIDPATDRALTFGGQGSITLAPGAEAYSDPVLLPTAPLENIAISMYFAGPTVVPTVHALGRQTAYFGSGNRVSDTGIAAAPADQRQSYYALAAVETASTEPANVVVTFGDSITDGFASTVDAAKRYPNQLDDRLKAAGLPRVGVVNMVISGNRWLNDVAGPSGNSRFDREVLGVTGATHTIILLGINDIGFSVAAAPTQEVSAAQIIDSMATAVGKAKARGLKVYLGTLLPYKGAGYYSEAGEAKRQAVNAWIRANRQVDGVIDFDQVMRNPADLLAMRPEYDSGDRLHPNDAGYGAMAAAIPLELLR